MSSGPIDLTDFEVDAAFDVDKLKSTPLEHLTTVLNKESFERYSSAIGTEIISSKPPQFQQLLLTLQNVLTTYGKNRETKSRRRVSSNKRAKINKRGGWTSGTGYGGNNGTDHSLLKKVETAKIRERTADVQIQNLLLSFRQALLDIVISMSDFWAVGLGCLMNCSIGHLTPTKRKRSSAKPQPTFTMNDILLTYWGNDSVMDVTGRLGLYSELLKIVDICGTAPPYTGLQATLFSNGDDEESDSDDSAVQVVLPGVKSTSLLAKKKDKRNIYMMMRKLNEQGRHFSQNVGDSNGVGNDTMEMKAFFQDLGDVLRTCSEKIEKNPYLRAELDESTPVSKKQRRDLLKLNATTGGFDKESLSKGYIEALKDIQFRSVSLLDLATVGNSPRVHYEFAQEACGLLGATGSNKTRMLRIGKEMSTMATSLPLSWGSGIFIRTDENRPDVMCAMILGPEDTPYANGAFVFDIWLPSNYPNVPPKVILKTTGHGSVRFNPNLYNNGKVCLSLLGTWAGPGWNKSTSTLLQVLVSIQSLIMVEQPYFNEPGYEVNLGTPLGDESSRSYNRVIRDGTMKYALLEHIRDPPYLFKDVLKLHFNLKHKEIRAQCAKWVSEAEYSSTGRYRSCSSSNSIENVSRRSTLGAMNDALDKLLSGTQQARQSPSSSSIVNIVDPEVAVAAQPPGMSKPGPVIVEQQGPVVDLTL
mmetsp:Transcript_26785/g.43077  ORF Transcript_26785/g.43077 Transcript_26785/m.43077 type:complete len:699 (-) Transcript_26785:1639-3735(-)|eukprot:CAMPEP_0203750516 /NCGR_PEP_ID=MMETSP0098-20131031/4724_1 /ASSEMBLY_ACC=CAM_ASM_000208 /TAXON_ID=96639 /ORGANISM=" , Strain NY0313808BC1" /LENGTH=698 /DNA_ID=CAMNT_0050639839 /DNA_START=90 /DNA_END=2186 /DNA_ORIENTATION=+